MTMGIVLVAFMAAIKAGVFWVTMAFTLSPASSAASPVSRQSFP